METLKAIRGHDIKKQDELMNVYLDRVTDKTSGLLTTAGLVFAIALFVMDRHFDWLAVLAATTAVAGIMLLTLNLGTVWRKDQSDWSPTPALIETRLFVFARRVVRLQFALWLIAISVVLSFGALLASELTIPKA